MIDDGNHEGLAHHACAAVLHGIFARLHAVEHEAEPAFALLFAVHIPGIARAVFAEELRREGNGRALHDERLVRRHGCTALAFKSAVCKMRPDGAAAPALHADVLHAPLFEAELRKSRRSGELPVDIESDLVAVHFGTQGNGLSFLNGDRLAGEVLPCRFGVLGLPHDLRQERAVLDIRLHVDGILLLVVGAEGSIEPVQLDGRVIARSLGVRDAEGGLGRKVFAVEFGGRQREGLGGRGALLRIRLRIHGRAADGLRHADVVEHGGIGVLRLEGDRRDRTLLDGRARHIVVVAEVHEMRHAAPRPVHPKLDVSLKEDEPEVRIICKIDGRRVQAAVQISRIVVDVMAVVVGHAEIGALRDDAQIDVVVVGAVEADEMDVELRCPRQFEIELHGIVVGCSHLGEGKIEQRIARHRPLSVRCGDVSRKRLIDAVREVLFVKHSALCFLGRCLLGRSAGSKGYAKREAERTQRCKQPFHGICERFAHTFSSV